MISIETLVFNPFEENTYIVFDETMECLIIDPGCYTTEEESKLVNLIENKELIPKLLINTHCHIDHVLGNSFVSATYNLPLQVPKADNDTLEAVPSYAATYGFPNYIHIPADRLIETNEKFTFGNSNLDVLFVPGHSVGHIALVNVEERVCLSGDVLFNGSIGRTDLPGGNFDMLIKSIHEQLFDLPDDTTVYPGHGITTTIGHEKKTNPFCALG